MNSKSKAHVKQKPGHVVQNSRLPFAAWGGTAIYGLYRYVPLWRVSGSQRQIPTHKFLNSPPPPPRGLPFAVKVTLSNGYHCLGDMAVLMGNVLTRWWVVVWRLAFTSNLVGVVIRSVELYDLVKTAFGFRLRFRRYDQVKTGSSESQAEAEEQNQSQSVGTCTAWLVWFSLDHKRRSHKRSRKKMETFWFFWLEYDSEFCGAFSISHKLCYELRLRH